MSRSVHLGEYTLRDIDVAGIAESFDTVTTAGRDQLVARLSAPVAEITDIQKRQAELRSIRAACKTADMRAEIDAARVVLRDTEEDVRAVLNAKTDKRHSEYYNQVMWAPDSFTSFLNERGWITELVVFFRTLFLPGMSVLMPLGILLMPVLLFRYVLKQPLTIEGYFKMITTALKKAMPSVLGKPHFAGRGGIMELGEQTVHLFVSAAVFVGSIWSQISAARSLRGVVVDMRARAASVRAATAAIGRLEKALGLPATTDLPSWSPSDLGLFGQVWNAPATAQRILDRAGELDMLVALALQKRVCFPKIGDRIALTDLYHPGTGLHRVTNSVSMGGEGAPRNILLTGPNRGGKSTLLKSLGAAVLMSQTVGIVFARRASLPVFDAIITALQPADKLGKMSLFEAEIEFAKGVKSLLDSSAPTTFLMMDEIFHGTNAHDGVEASQVFLDELYATPAPLFSVVSTHYMGLPERYGSVGSGTRVAQTLCMDAATDPTDPDRLIYTYKLKEGINQLSSVREILRDRGLLTTKTVCVVRAGEKSVVSASKA